MKKNLKITPEGMKDFLFAECSAMDDVCGKIEKVFAKGDAKTADNIIQPGKTDNREQPENAPGKSGRRKPFPESFD